MIYILKNLTTWLIVGGHLVDLKVLQYFSARNQLLLWVLNTKFLLKNSLCPIGWSWQLYCESVGNISVKCGILKVQTPPYTQPAWHMVSQCWKFYWILFFFFCKVCVRYISYTVFNVKSSIYTLTAGYIYLVETGKRRRCSFLMNSY